MLLALMQILDVEQPTGSPRAGRTFEGETPAVVLLFSGLITAGYLKAALASLDGDGGGDMTIGMDSFTSPFTMSSVLFPIMEVFSSVSFMSVYLLLSCAVAAYHLHTYPRARNESHGAKPESTILPSGPYKPQILKRPWDVLGLAKIAASLADMSHGRSLESMAGLFDTLGETYAFWMLGQKITMTCHPDNIRHMLLTRFDDFHASQGIRDHLFGPLMRHSIFVAEGPAWKAARRVFRGVFSSTRAVFDAATQEEAFGILVRRIPAGDGEAFDLQPLLRAYSYDVLSTFATGESMDCLRGGDQAPEKRRFVDELSYVEKKIAVDSYLGPVHYLTSRRRFHAACAHAQGYVDKLVERRLAKAKQDEESGVADDNDGMFCLLDVLIDNSAASDHSLPLVRDAVLTTLVAGIDSVAVVLDATFWLLARHPSIYSKLRNHILSKLSHSSSSTPSSTSAPLPPPPTLDDLKSMPYLAHVLNEAMRVLPPVPINARAANRDTFLPVGGGPDGLAPVRIPKGGRVVFATWASHRNKRVFGPDAAEFRPERWEGGGGKAEGYVPFSMGPRACPGQNYATMIASYVTVRLVQKFPRLSSADERPWEEALGMNLHNKNGVLVRMHSE